MIKRRSVRARLGLRRRLAVGVGLSSRGPNAALLGRGTYEPRCADPCRPLRCAPALPRWRSSGRALRSGPYGEHGLGWHLTPRRLRTSRVGRASQRRLRRAPASDRSGVALSACGLVVGWWCPVVACPRRALFERTSNPAGAQAAAAFCCARVDFRRLHPRRVAGTGGPARRGQTTTSANPCPLRSTHRATHLTRLNSTAYQEKPDHTTLVPRHRISSPEPDAPTLTDQPTHLTGDYLGRKSTASAAGGGSWKRATLPKYGLHNFHTPPRPRRPPPKRPGPNRGQAAG
jgi:hypothetical protein